ncbi:MAG: hypothetical protein U5M50_09365 [Sphingobium sp.]|nr:hypothetical protein [Sphingobium sp.]
MTTSEEKLFKSNLSFIYCFSKKGVNTNAIAGMLVTKAFLSNRYVENYRKDLVKYQKISRCFFNNRKRNINRKNDNKKTSVTGSFFAEKLNFTWAEAHEIAEELETHSI